MPTVNQFVSTIDRTIFGAVVLELGRTDASGHTVDRESLRQLVSLGNARPSGIKAIYGYSNALRDALGSFLGRWTNFRLSADGRSVLADLKLSPIAFSSVKKIGAYVMALTKEDPEALGAEVNAMLAKPPKLGAKAFRIQVLRSINLLDEPRLTSGGLFGDGQQPPTVSRRTTKAGASTHPKGSDQMQTVPKAKYDALQAQATALRARLKQAEVRRAAESTITLAHYDAGDPIAIDATGCGLTADEVGAVRQPVAAKALEEYARSSDRLRHGGTNLTSYMQGAYVDERAGEVPPLLQSACTKLQQHFGPVVDMAGGGLTYV